MNYLSTLFVLIGNYIKLHRFTWMIWSSSHRLPRLILKYLLLEVVIFLAEGGIGPWRISNRNHEELVLESQFHDMGIDGITLKPSYNIYNSEDFDMIYYEIHGDLLGVVMGLTDLCLASCG